MSSGPPRRSVPNPVGKMVTGRAGAPARVTGAGRGGRGVPRAVKGGSVRRSVPRKGSPKKGHLGVPRPRRRSLSVNGDDDGPSPAPARPLPRKSVGGGSHMRKIVPVKRAPRAQPQPQGRNRSSTASSSSGGSTPSRPLPSLTLPSGGESSGGILGEADLSRLAAALSAVSVSPRGAATASNASSRAQQREEEEHDAHGIASLLRALDDLSDGSEEDDHCDDQHHHPQRQQHGAHNDRASIRASLQRPPDHLLSHNRARRSLAPNTQTPTVRLASSALRVKGHNPGHQFASLKPKRVSPEGGAVMDPRKILASGLSGSASALRPMPRSPLVGPRPERPMDALPLPNSSPSKSGSPKPELSPEEQAAKVEQQRKRAFNEILETERKYVAGLKNLIDNYLEPLEQPSSPLNSIQCRTIFCDLRTIYGVNAALLSEIERDPERMGFAFRKMSMFLKIYGNYCAEYDKASVMVKELFATNPKFTEFCQRVKAADSNRLDLNDYLIWPIQRICKYPLLFRELIKYTPEDDPELAGLKDVYSDMKRVAQQVNEHKKTAEKLRKLMELESVLNLPQGFHFLVPHRRFLQDGTFEVRRASVNGAKSKKMTLWLFSDMLVYGSPRAGKGSIMQQLRSHRKKMDTALHLDEYVSVERIRGRPRRNMLAGSASSVVQSLIDSSGGGGGGGGTGSGSGSGVNSGTSSPVMLMTGEMSNDVGGGGGGGGDMLAESGELDMAVEANTEPMFRVTDNNGKTPVTLDVFTNTHEEADAWVKAIHVLLQHAATVKAQHQVSDQAVREKLRAVRRVQAVEEDVRARLADLIALSQDYVDRRDYMMSTLEQMVDWLEEVRTAFGQEFGVEVPQRPHLDDIKEAAAASVKVE